MVDLESIIINSKISPTGNGVFDPNNPNIEPPTSGQKTWVAILIGMIFLVISSPIVDILLGNQIKIKPKVFLALLLKTLIFTIIIRMIIW